VATEVYRIEIPIEVNDQSATVLDAARVRVTRFEQAIQRTERQMRRTTATRWQLTVYALDRASAVIGGIERRAMSLARTGIRIPLRIWDFATAPLRAIGSMATSTLGLLGIGVGGYAAVRGGIMWPVEMADNLTRAKIGFETMLGSAQAAEEFLQRVQTFAIETPFKTDELIQYSNLLLALGWKADSVIPALQAIGDQVDAMGGGAEQIQRIIIQLGQMRMKGRVSAEEMTVLAENNVNAWKYVADAMGLTVEQVRDLAEKGKLQAEPAIAAILKGMEKAFGGSMARNANKTLGGILSQIKDVFDIKLMARWGEGLRDAVLPGFVNVNDWLNKNAEVVEKWGDRLYRLGQTVGGWVVARFEDLSRTWERLNSNPLFQKADFFGKVRIAWDEIVVKGFDRWWSAGGRDVMVQRASQLGAAMGGGLGGLLSGLFGLPGRRTIDFPVEPTMGSLRRVEAIQEDPFLEQGRVAGTAFFKAFLEAFDANQVAQKAAKAIQDSVPDMWNAYRQTLPRQIGGETELGPGSLAMIALGIWGLSKIPGARWLGRKVFGGLGELFGRGAGAVGRVAREANLRMAAGSVAAGAGEAAIRVTAQEAAEKGAAIFAQKAGLGLLERLGARLGVAAVANAVPVAGQIASLAMLGWTAWDLWNAREEIGQLASQVFQQAPEPTPYIGMGDLRVAEGPMPVQIESLPPEWSRPTPPPEVLIAPGAVNVSVYTQELDRDKAREIGEQAGQAAVDRLVNELGLAFGNMPALGYGAP